MEQTMTQGNLAGILIRFSIPLVLSGILQQMYAWADAFIVGNLVGEDALAAVGATVSLYNLFVLVVTGLTLGVSILAAQMYGRGEREGLRPVLSTFAVVLGATFLAVGLLGSLLAGPVLELMSTTEDTIAMSRQYLEVVLLGLPVVAVYNVYAAVLRGMGESRAPLYAVLVASLVNVGVDLLLVGPANMGVRGAALATVASQIMMTLFLMGYAVRRVPLLRFRPARGSVDRAALRAGLALGLPVAIQSSINSLGSVVLQNFMNSFDSSRLVAAITTAYRVDTVILLPVTNLSSGISTVVAQNIGARKPERARKGLGVGLAIMLAMSIGLSALVTVAGEPLIALFGLTPEASAMGGEFFRTLALFYPVFGLGMALRGYLEGTGDVMWSSAIGISALLLRIVLSYGLADRVGSPIIAYAEMASWAAMLLLFALRVLVRSRKAAAGPSQAV